jgi:hypothetical protein
MKFKKPKLWYYKNLQYYELIKLKRLYNKECIKKNKKVFKENSFYLILELIRKIHLFFKLIFSVKFINFCLYLLNH